MLDFSSEPPANHVWPLGLVTFGGAERLRRVSEPALLLPDGCWVHSPVMRLTCGSVRSSLDAAQRLSHPRAAVACDGDEAHRGQPPPPPPTPIEITTTNNRKANWEQPRVPGGPQWRIKGNAGRFCGARL